MMDMTQEISGSWFDSSIRVDNRGSVFYTENGGLSWTDLAARQLLIEFAADCAPKIDDRPASSLSPGDMAVVKAAWPHATGLLVALPCQQFEQSMRILEDMPVSLLGEVMDTLNHPATRPGDVAGILAMPAVTPEELIGGDPCEVPQKASPQGLGALWEMDHRLGLFK
jgi:hypothetical protein